MGLVPYVIVLFCHPVQSFSGLSWNGKTRWLTFNFGPCTLAPLVKHFETSEWIIKKTFIQEHLQLFRDPEMSKRNHSMWPSILLTSKVITFVTVTGKVFIMSFRTEEQFPNRRCADHLQLRELCQNESMSRSWLITGWTTKTITSMVAKVVIFNTWEMHK